MERFDFGMAELIADLRVIVADAENEWEILEQARPLVEWVSQKPESWLLKRRFRSDGERNYGANILHEEPGNNLTICTAAWSPGSYIAPHDHHTWEIVSCVIGTIRHTCWTKVEDVSNPGDIRIEKGCDFLMRPGQAAAVMPREIHALENFGPSMGLSLHIYGCKLAGVERRRFDPECGLEEKWVDAP